MHGAEHTVVNSTLNVHNACNNAKLGSHPCGESELALFPNLAAHVLSPGLPEVRQLNLAFCKVSDTGLLALASASTHLSHLVLASKAFYNLWSCGLWSDAGVMELRRRRPEVEVVLTAV